MLSRWAGWAVFGVFIVLFRPETQFVNGRARYSGIGSAYIGNARYFIFGNRTFFVEPTPPPPRETLSEVSMGTWIDWLSSATLGAAVTASALWVFGEEGTSQSAETPQLAEEAGKIVIKTNISLLQDSTDPVRQKTREILEQLREVRAERVEVDAALHEQIGDAIPWDERVPPEMQPEHVKALIEKIYPGIPFELDCEEPPCAVLLQGQRDVSDSTLNLAGQEGTNPNVQVSASVERRNGRTKTGLTISQKGFLDETGKRRASLRLQDALEAAFDADEAIFPSADSSP